MADPQPAGSFVHLHVKSQFSLLSALGTPGELVARARALGYSALALTDEMNLFAAVEFAKECKDQGLRPIIGAELIVAPQDATTDRNKPRENHRLVALVEDERGYRSLNYLLTQAHLHGRYFVPRIDKPLLEAHHEGLILLSGDLRGEVPRLLGQGRYDDAAAAATWFRDLMGPDHYFFELMDLGWGASNGGLGGEPDQREVNQRLRQLAAQLGIRCVVTNNVHYEQQKDAFPHEALLAIGMQNTLSDVGRFRFPSDQFYLKSPAEMAALFPDDDAARQATVEIAERCHFKFEMGKYRFPIYPRLDGRTPEDVLEALSWEGLQSRFETFRRSWPAEKLDRWDHWERRYRERLEMELKVIRQMKFSAYFLIVYDFIRYAKENDIPVGPGRGSGAGSLCLYSLRITDIDPLPYNLLFERFLNPERISMPDVDVDFCQDRRGEVIQYVNREYGGETRVSQIITFGKMLAKGVLRDVGRVMGLTPQESDRLAKLVPEELGITLEQAEAKEPKFKEALDADPRLRRLFEIAKVLEGTTRHCSVHAAGVVLADDDLREYCPLYKGSADEDPVCTQYDMKWAEKIGLIKFDFLGLKTLTQVKHALDMARVTGRTEWTFSTFNDIPVDDPAVYRMLSRGDALGVFQLESSGMRELLRAMKPTTFEDIVAVAALYRPGPMGAGMHHTFVECKHGRTQVKYPHPSLVPVLKDTYGVIVYQEQVMQIAQVMGDYSLGEADLLRRAMGKKDAKEMAKQRDRFLQGTRAKGIGDENANEVFDLMAKFAEYGFNKSHTAAYGLIAYQTAWLKCHLAPEFFAALLTIESGSTDKVLLYLDDARKHGVEVLPPDVNESERAFTVVGGRVRFGLGAVKNVGESAIESILAARTAGGRFVDLGDFVARVDLRRVNKRVLESLVKCGAFDSMGLSRAAILTQIDKVLEYGQNRAKDANSGQVGLFGAKAKQVGVLRLQTMPEWPDNERLSTEKEALGFYISGHPMDAWGAEVRRFAPTTTAELAERKREDVVKLAGLPGAVKVIRTKAKNEEMAFVQFEDKVGSVEVTVFPRTWAEIGPLFALGEPLLLEAKIDDVAEDGVKLLAEGAELLAQVRERDTKEVRFELRPEDADDAHLAGLRALLAKHPGQAEARILLQVAPEVRVRLHLGPTARVNPNGRFMHEAGELFGRRVVALG